MMSEYYTKDELINVLKSHLLPEDATTVDWNHVVDDGEIYPKMINDVDGCYIYQINTINGFIVIFVHPTICVETYFDAWTPKDVYMGRAEGEIW
jgi:hypothetical protein